MNELLQTRRPAAALVRVSTDQQAEHGGSIADQMKVLAAFAEQHGLEIVEWYGHGDRSGASKATSPDFVRMLDEAPTAHWEVVIVETVDRFRRNLRDAVGGRDALKDAGKGLIILQLGSTDITDDDGPGAMSFALLSHLAEAEHRRMKARGRKAHRTKLDRGQWNGGFQSTGYRYGNQAKGERSLLKDESLSGAVEFIWRKLLAGWASHQIANALTDNGHLSPRGSVDWPQSTVLTIAHSPLYCGHVYAYDSDGEKRRDAVGNRGDWEPYITVDEWLTVQRLLAVRHNRPRHRRGGRPSKKALLARGLGKCGLCGGSLYPRSDTGKYYCKSKKTTRKCSLPHIPVEWLDTRVREAIRAKNLIDLESVLHSLRQTAAQESSEREQQVHALNLQLARLRADIESLAAREASDEVLALVGAKHRLIENLAAKRERLELQLIDAPPLPDIEATKDVLDQLHSAFVLSAGADIQHLSTQLRDALDAVVVYPYRSDRPLAPMSGIKSLDRYHRRGDEFVISFLWNDTYVADTFDAVKPFSVDEQFARAFVAQLGGQPPARDGHAH